MPPINIIMNNRRLFLGVVLTTFLLAGIVFLLIGFIGRFYIGGDGGRNVFPLFIAINLVHFFSCTVAVTPGVIILSKKKKLSWLSTMAIGSVTGIVVLGIELLIGTTFGSLGFNLVAIPFFFLIGAISGSLSALTFCSVTKLRCKA